MLSWKEPTRILDSNSCPYTEHTKNQTKCPRALSILLLNSDRLGAVTASLRVWVSLFRAWKCQYEGMSAEWWAEGGCPCHPWPRWEEVLTLVSPPLLNCGCQLNQYLTNTYLRDARGGFHSRAQMALPRWHFCNWFWPRFIIQLSMNIALKPQGRMTSIELWSLWD